MTVQRSHLSNTNISDEFKPDTSTLPRFDAWNTNSILGDYTPARIDHFKIIHKHYRYRCRREIQHFLPKLIIGHLQQNEQQSFTFSALIPITPLSMNCVLSLISLWLLSVWTQSNDTYIHKEICTVYCIKSLDTNIVWLIFGTIDSDESVSTAHILCRFRIRSICRRYNGPKRHWYNVWNTRGSMKNWTICSWNIQVIWVRKIWTYFVRN